MKIINKKTKEVYEVIGLFSSDEMRNAVLIGNVKTKELTMVKCYVMLRDYELKGGKN